jgi:hypothetical protein
VFGHIGAPASRWDGCRAVCAIAQPEAVLGVLATVVTVVAAAACGDNAGAGSTVSPGFAALRDGRPLDHPRFAQLAAGARAMFDRLAAAGVDRAALVLACGRPPAPATDTDPRIGPGSAPDRPRDLPTCRRTVRGGSAI